MIIQKSKSIRELVYEELKRLIIEGEIESGERIVETDYAKKFNISRTPIREAIRMLELEGYVETQRTGGVVVKEITKSDIEEIYRIRIALEGVIIEDVIQRATKKDIRTLERLIEDTKDALDDSDPEEVFRLFSEFNIALYNISNLTRVIDMITNIKLYLSRFRRIATENNERRKVAFEDHRGIIEAIKEKDTKKATELNRVHLERSRNFIIEEL